MNTETKENLNFLKWAAWLPAGMLLLAVLPLPYGYYILLRWIVCGSGVIFAIAGWHFLKPLAVLSSLQAILFNPLVPVYLNKEAWSVVDLAAAIYILIAWALLQGRQKNPPLPEAVQDIFEQVIRSIYGKSRDNLTEADRLAFYIFWTKEKDRISRSDAVDIGKLFDEFKANYAEELKQFKPRNP